MNRNILILAAIAALATGAWLLTSPSSVTPPPEELVAEAQASQDFMFESEDWALPAGYAFTFKYPEDWGWVESPDHTQVRVVNTLQSEGPEQLVVQYVDTPCEEPATTFQSKSAYDSGWGTDSDGVHERSICVPTPDRALHMTATVADEAAKAIVDTMLASFAFAE